MKRSKKGKQALAMALSTMLVVNGLPTAVLAGGKDARGLCAHHPSHTADCGFAEAQPCGHMAEGGEADREGFLWGSHMEGCYTDELVCGLIEDEDMVVATGSDWEDTQAASGHKHSEDCYGLDCPHERGEHEEGDGACGYVEAQPCGFDCQESHDDFLVPGAGTGSRNSQKPVMLNGEQQEYDIYISGGGLIDFDVFREGYTVNGDPDENVVQHRVVDVYNQGSKHDDSLSVSLEGEHAGEYFSISKTTLNWNDYGGGNGGFDSFTIEPKPGLAKGTYEAMLKVEGVSSPTVTAEVKFIVEAGSFVPVTNIKDVPASMTAGTSLTLTGTVEPDDASEKAIVWNLTDAGTTGATLDVDILSAASAGTVMIRATVENGIAQDQDYTQDFTITVDGDYRIYISGGDIDFGVFQEGYTVNGDPDENVVQYRVVDVYNQGSEHDDSLSVSLEGEHAGQYFTISKTTLNWSNYGGGNGGYDSFTIEPKMDLGKGVYEATLKVQGASTPAVAVGVKFIVETDSFVPVTNIKDVPTSMTAGTPLTLTGMVEPDNAANKDIVWSLEHAGTTGAALNGSILSAASAGQVTVRATVRNGIAPDHDYTQDFTIAVSPKASTGGGGGNGGGGGSSSGNDSNTTTSDNQNSGDSGQGDVLIQETTDGKFIVVNIDPSKIRPLFDQNGDLAIKIISAGKGNLLVQETNEMPEQETIDRMLGVNNNGQLLSGMDVNIVRGSGSGQAVVLGSGQNHRGTVVSLAPQEQRGEQGDPVILEQNVRDMIRQVEDNGVDMGIVREVLENGSVVLPNDGLQRLQGELETIYELVQANQESRRGQEAGQVQEVGRGQTAGQVQEVDRGQTTGQAQEVGQGQTAGQVQEVGQGQTAGQVQEIGQGQTAGQAQEVGRGQEAGQVQEVGRGQEAGQAQEVGRGQTAGQVQEVGRGQEAGQVPEVGRGQTAGQAQEVGRGQEVGQAQEVGRGQEVGQTGTAGRYQPSGGIHNANQVKNIAAWLNGFSTSGSESYSSGMLRIRENKKESEETEQETFMFLVQDERVRSYSHVTMLHKVDGQWVDEVTFPGDGFVVVVGVKHFSPFALVADPGTLVLQEEPVVCTYQPNNTRLQEGLLQAEVPASGIQTAIELCRKLTGQSESAPGGMAVAIDLSESSGPGAAFDTCVLTISEEACKKMEEAGVQRLDVKTRQMVLSLDAGELSAIYGTDGDTMIRLDMASQSYTIQ